jgi:hypothetical protein
MMLSHQLKGEKIKELSEQSYKHEVPCNDLYVALHNAFNGDFEWIPESDQKSGFRFDRAFSVYGKQFYVELERGTQDIKDIELKVEQYKQMRGHYHVIFSLMDYKVKRRVKVDDKWKTQDVTVKEADKFMPKVLSFFEIVNRGTQFVATLHDFFVQNPLDDVLGSHLKTVFTLEHIR